MAAFHGLACMKYCRKNVVQCTLPKQFEYTPQGVSNMNLATVALNALFSYKPFFKFAAGKARKMIIERGTEIGYPWEPELLNLKKHDWNSEFRAAENTNLTYPEYYLKPFHAYENGNLSWDAALEVELAAKSVHANVFDPERKKLEPDGDEKLRNSYHEKLLSMLKESPKYIVDIGCSTGLSTFGLLEAFPQAEIVGVDMSPYFISVANYKLKQASSNLDRHFPLKFIHAPGEYTSLPSGTFDLISICLVCHELPRYVTKLVLNEANRLLKPGGALSIMEMNPYSASLQRMVNNMFAFTAFKSTEPYFDDYRTFPIEDAIQERGFSYPLQAESSPHHRTMVSFKRK